MHPHRNVRRDTEESSSTGIIPKHMSLLTVVSSSSPPPGSLFDTYKLWAVGTFYYLGRIGHGFSCYDLKLDRDALKRFGTHKDPVQLSAKPTVHVVSAQETYISDVNLRHNACHRKIFVNLHDYVLA